MKSKYLVILSSLIILMLSLSVVSAAVADGVDIDTSDDKSDVNDVKVVSKENAVDKKDVDVVSKKVEEKKLTDEPKKVAATDDSKVKVVLSASYSNKENNC